MWLQIVVVVVLVGLLLVATACVLIQATKPATEELDEEPTETQAEYDPLAHERILASLARTREINARLQSAQFGPKHDGQEL